MEKTSKITLRSYIEDNHELLEVLAVFIALAIFFQNTNIIQFGIFLSLLALTGAMVVLFELFRTIPDGDGQFLMILFGGILSIIVFVFTFYWFVSINDALGAVGINDLFILILLMIIFALEKHFHFLKYIKTKIQSKIKWLLTISIISLFGVALISGLSLLFINKGSPLIEGYITSHFRTDPNIIYLLRENSTSSFSFAVNNIGQIPIKNLSVDHVSFIYVQLLSAFLGVTGQSQNNFQPVGFNWLTSDTLNGGQIAQAQFPAPTEGNALMSAEVFYISYERSYDSKPYSAQAIYFINQGQMYTLSQAKQNNDFATATRELPQAINSYRNFPIGSTLESTGNDFLNP